MKLTEPEKKFSIVAFRYDQRRSVLYKACKTEGEVAKEVLLALHGRDADVISIRRVYKKRPTPNKKTL